MLLHWRHGFRLCVRCMRVRQGRRLGLPRKEAFVHHCVLHREPERVVLHHRVRLRGRKGEARWEHLHHGGLLRVHHKGHLGRRHRRRVLLHKLHHSCHIHGRECGGLWPVRRPAGTSIGEVGRCPRSVLACRVGVWIIPSLWVGVCTLSRLDRLHWGIAWCR